YEKLTDEEEKETRKNFRDLVECPSGKFILDVGCGCGHDAEYFEKMGAMISGIDISEKEIEIAKSKTKGNFIVGKMNNLPYKDNTFDIVLSVYSLQSSENVTGAINEMIRVAKPGAQILILTKHPFRNLLESYKNDNKMDYWEKRNVTSYILNRKIKLSEPGHTIMEYFDQSVLEKVKLELFIEKNDFPASEQVIAGLNYPTYMIIKFRKL
ncbi:MAG: class I SAM-dependent methyltransferase, partial [Nanoarchaeota archaeon]|nr:class I SAM-dependent methyltransferase [Nanoarchaeota archaeon]